MKRAVFVFWDAVVVHANAIVETLLCSMYPTGGERGGGESRAAKADVVPILQREAWRIYIWYHESIFWSALLF